MKKFYLLLLLFTISLNAQQPFITQWFTSVSDLTITIPVVGDVDNDYTVDFGDGIILTGQTGNVSHTYSAPGTYTITMSGSFGRLDCSILDEADSSQFHSIDQWGDIQWTSMENAFINCENLEVNAVDVPDLSQVISLKNMFMNIDSINESLNNWDVSNITDMSGMFSRTSYGHSLGNWDVSNVIDMSDMFKSSYNTNNLNLNNWDVSNVTNMSHMFHQASTNEPLDLWDVSNVTNMSYMFAHASSFNQPIDSWNVSNVTDMSYMFNQASDFNQSLNNWDVFNVIDMSHMFFNASQYNQPLDGWDVSNVTTMSRMFLQANDFNQSLDTWDVSNVTDMQMMFNKASMFNQPLNNWDVSNVTTMTMMFRHATSFNQPLSNWNVSNVTQMGAIFEYASNFNQDISDWNFNPEISYLAIGWSALDMQNYDALLLRFAQLGLQNKYLNAFGIAYCDLGVHDYLITELGWTISEDWLASECIGNYILGNVNFDFDANGCESNDLAINNLLVTANNGEFSYSTVTSNGEYDIRVMDDILNVSLQNIPTYYTVSPPSPTVSFTGFGSEQEINFCLMANESVNDLNITLLPINEARPGFHSTYRLVAQNIGTQSVNAVTASFSYDETLQVFVNASQTPSSSTINQLNFNFGTLQPFESQTVDVTMQTFTPPLVNGGEIISFVAAITPNTSDFTPNNNTFSYDQEVVNSFDPNDKKVLQGNQIYMEQTQSYLDYIIRFQNTGSASAITVIIEDILHENLDWTTFQPISSSHSYNVEIIDGNKVKFIFNNINLPHEASNEPGSHGFIAYKIKPVVGIGVGDIITGHAEIFFDYNLPIITNSADTEVVETMGTTGHNLETINLYPNPAYSRVYLNIPAWIEVKGIKIFNLQGSEIMSSDTFQDHIDVSNLSSGLYTVVIQTDKGLSNHRLIKK